VAKAFVGTSGWVYKSWKGRFYPTDLKSDNYLHFYADEFPTAEVNYSFYKLPSLETYEKWAVEVPSDFIFAVKASRYLTHMKKLKDPEEPWKLLTEHAAPLQKHLGPILLQFPEKWSVNLDRLKEFLAVINAEDAHFKTAFEFRHESWFVPEVMKLLEKYGSALCIADSSKFVRQDTITSDFTYVRYHGRGSLYASNYSIKQLEIEASKLDKYLRQGITVFAYFNNDAEAKAIKNAKTLTSLLAS
jgi:uncharacterized protein YecE (DUF72 family)